MNTKSLLEKLRRNDTHIIRLFISLILIVLVASLTKPQFFMIRNFQSMAAQMTEYGLMALGVSITMLSGGIDLSTVYIANLSGISSAIVINKLLEYDLSRNSLIIIGIAIALLVGCLCGLFNGLLISYLSIPPMLATLGSFQLFLGLAIVISSGQSVAVANDLNFSKIGNSSIFSIPLPFIVFISIALLLMCFMKRTKFGKRVLLIGSNSTAAVFAGIRTKNVIIKTYILSGMLSATAGILSLSKINSAKADFGSSYTMQSILIVVLGGIHPDGGKGSIAGVTIAIVILQVISSYLNTFPKLSNYIRDVIWGLALLFVLVLNELISRRNKYKQ